MVLDFPRNRHTRRGYMRRIVQWRTLCVRRSREEQMVDGRRFGSTGHCDSWLSFWVTGSETPGHSSSMIKVCDG